MDLDRFRKMPLDELDKVISDLRKELFALRFQLATGQLEKTHLIKSTRRLIAKVITIKHEREAKANK